jgi:hypothetical protein
MNMLSQSWEQKEMVFGDYARQILALRTQAGVKSIRIQNPSDGFLGMRYVHLP